ncbi:hypothetical protein B0H21DRAFT_805853 [Amylocystis lapponica]|nr:hypothetical protein B0H21DRAFT_805853 [Amylocystis lapponica]
MLKSCRFSLVKGARSSLKKGSKAQYYPISPPQNAIYNPDRPPVYDLNALPLRTEQNFWDTIQQLSDAVTKAARIRITKETGISRMPLAAASPAFLHPSFFPLDPFHLFFENIVAFLWDLWTTLSSPNESFHLRKDVMEIFGKLVVAAMATLPPSFCGLVRDPHLKRQSQYKIYEWMALLYWYIIPIGIELGFSPALLANYAKLAEIIEFAMTIKPRSHQELSDMHSKIVTFLSEFQTIYIGDDPEKVSRFRLCVFQLIHVPMHIVWYGSIRLGSQATVERTIGHLGRKIRSKKSPFANLASILYESQMVNMLTLYYPQLSHEHTSSHLGLFTNISVRRKERTEGQAFLNQLRAAFMFLQKDFDRKTSVQRWGKLRLHAKTVLNTQLSETRGGKLPSRSHRYFEALAHTADKDPIFGEALSFLKIDPYPDELVIFHPLVDITHPLNACRGRWSQSLQVLPVSKIVDIVGIWNHGDSAYVLRKHPGLDWLNSEERGVESDSEDENN